MFRPLTILALFALAACHHEASKSGSRIAAAPCMGDDCAKPSQGDHPLKAWQPDYSHYSALDEGNIVFKSSWGDTDFGADHLVLSGQNAAENPSGLFMFLRKRLIVDPQTQYKVVFHVNATFDFAKDCTTPILIKGGAGDLEPLPVMAPDYMMRTSITQDQVLARERISAGGEITASCANADKRLAAQPAFEHLVPAKSSADGTLWVYVGFESGSREGIRIALQNISVDLTPMKQIETTGDGIQLNYSFQNPKHGWTAAFADYPTGQEQFYELKSEDRPLPVELKKTGNGFYLSGNNHSDDLLMYLWTRVGLEQGLKPETAYRLDYTVKFASNVPQHCQGAGGAEGESVTVKVGGANRAPAAAPDANGILRLNWDVGSQTHGGADASVAGHVANHLSCNELGHDERPYDMVTRQHSHTHAVKTDAAGNLWLFVGTDSGFEATTSLYFSEIQIKLTPVLEP